MTGSFIVYIGTEMRVGKSEALVPVVSVNDKMAPDPPHCKVSTEMTDAFDKIYRWRTWAGNMPSFVLYSWFGRRSIRLHFDIKTGTDVNAGVHHCLSCLVSMGRRIPMRCCVQNLVAFQRCVIEYH